MKYIIKIIILGFITFAVTGCVKYNVDMQISKDKKVELEIKLGKIVSNFEEGYLDDVDNNDYSLGIQVSDYNYLTAQGYRVMPYEEEKDNKSYKGVIITKSFKSIDDIAGIKSQTVNFMELIEKDTITNFDETQLFLRDGIKYKSNFVFDLKDEETETEVSDYDLKYTVTIPYKSIKNNASIRSKDGKTLTWILELGKNNDVNFEFILLPKFLTSIESKIIFFGIAEVILILGIVFIVKNKKNKPAKPKKIKAEQKIDARPTSVIPIKLDKPSPQNKIETLDDTE